MRRPAPERVFRDYTQAGRAVEALRLRGKRIVFTNGVFDLFHLGHLGLLEEARALGDALVVGVNSDLSVKRIKGRLRPVIGEEARAQIVAGARAVDLCVIFTEKDPGRLLRFIRPDVLVKGSQYTLSRVVGKRFVEGYGGRVILVPHLEGWSTTEIVRRAGSLAGQRSPEESGTRRGLTGQDHVEKRSGLTGPDHSAARRSTGADRSRPAASRTRSTPPHARG